MWIFKSERGDPMLLDTEQGLRDLHEHFVAFLASREEAAIFSAETGGSPSPYEKFLGGLRVRKSDSDPELRYAEDGWLELSGPLSDLEDFAVKILVTEDQGHRHWYGAPVSLTFEADTYWPIELREG